LQNHGINFQFRLTKRSRQLVGWDIDPKTSERVVRDIKEQEVFFCDFPVMVDLYEDENGKKEIINRSNAIFEACKKRYQRMAPGHPSGFIEAFANLYSDIYNAFSEFKDKGYFANENVSDYIESLDSLKFFKNALKVSE